MRKRVSAQFGDSCTTGFVLRGKYRGQIIEAATPGYDEAEVTHPTDVMMRPTKIVFSIGLLLFWAPAFFLDVEAFVSGSLMGFAFTILWFVGAFVLVLLYSVWKNPKRLQIASWHGVEHMTAHAVFQKRHTSLTAEKLQQSYRVTMLCGTRLPLMLLWCSHAFGIGTWMVWGLLPEGASAWAALSFIVVVFCGSLLFQYFVSTTEPDAEQITQALVVADELWRQMDEIDAR